MGISLYALFTAVYWIKCEIDVNVLKKALMNLGIDIKNQTLQNMLADIDKNVNANIDLDEFIDMMTVKMSDKDSRKDLEKIFEWYLNYSLVMITLIKLISGI